MKALMILSLVGPISLAFAAPTPVKTEDHPKVLLQEIKPLEDKRRVIVPVKVEAKIQSLVTADIEGHVTKILKPLGSSVKSGEIILFLENRDPGFYLCRCPRPRPDQRCGQQFLVEPNGQSVPRRKTFYRDQSEIFETGAAEFPVANWASCARASRASSHPNLNVIPKSTCALLASVPWWMLALAQPRLSLNSSIQERTFRHRLAAWDRRLSKSIKARFS